MFIWLPRSLLRSRLRLGFTDLFTSDESTHIPLQMLDQDVRNCFGRRDLGDRSVESVSEASADARVAAITLQEFASANSRRILATRFAFVERRR
jgi:hypothetical protein